MCNNFEGEILVALHKVSFIFNRNDHLQYKEAICSVASSLVFHRMPQWIRNKNSRLHLVPRQVFVQDIHGGREEFRLQCLNASSVVLLLWFESVDGSQTRWERGISAAELTCQFLLLLL